MITLLQHQIKIAWNKALKQAVLKSKTPKVELADKAGITAASLRHILDGERGTRVSTLFPLIEALEMDLWLTDKEGHSWRLKP